MKKMKSCYLYLKGERILDALAWALERNIMLTEAKKKLKEIYGSEAEFIIE